MKKNIFLFIFLFFFLVSIKAAITVNINSGNPTMPFPQFINYPAGGQTTLYSIANWAHLPDGVTHAELEKYIRDAYQIMMNRANYAGGNIRGVQGIKFESQPVTTEGHGYALLAAALMGDKTTFDGLWFYLNDNCWFNGVAKYHDGTICSGTYKYGYHAPGWSGPTTDSAADADVDIALAALIAWRQWGDNTGYTRWDGQPIRYKDMALDMIRFLVEKAEGDITGDGLYTSGDIGFDGYTKGGNTWLEVTNWASSQTGDKPQFAGPMTTYFDYSAPFYYRCFAEALQANGDSRDSGWNITQFQKAAAAMNWVMGQLAASSHRTTYAGQYTVNGTSVTFANANPGGEDFRAPWRHALDYLWYGNPSTSWDPTTHQVIAGSNTYERDAAIKLANYLNDPQAAGVYGCKTYGASPITYRGSPSIVAFQLNGSSYFDFHTNFLFGASAGAVVISQNFDLMGQWLRELLIEWGVEIAGDNYLTSVPLYFHCFFRVLGLLTLTGNHPNPANWNAQANMKIYKAVNKTYTYPGDTITYWINYRNLGSITATGVYIRDTLPAGFQYLASSPTAPSNPSSNVYEWGPFTVPGLQNQNYSATMSGITLIVRVGDNVSPGKYCITSDIRAANGTGWTTSDEANEITTICKTNCIDIVAPSLSITKTANPVIVNPYNTITYTINFCNSSTTWLEGGHNGIIFSAGVRSVPGASDTEIYLDFAGHHEAAEPVIDWNNYRISYFVNSSNHEGEWQLYINQIQPPGMTLNISSENYSACTPTPCYDPLSGKYYNKRIIIQPSSMPSAPTHHLYNYWGNMSRIHLGTATTPFYFEARLTANYNPQDWTDDWSQQTSDVIVSGPQVMMYPISPDWTDGDLATPGVVLNKVNKHACQTTLTKIENILIEEWDGYAWRKVFGNAPVANTKISNIVVFDSIPNHLNWGGFVSTTGSCSYNPGNRTIQCNINELKAGDCGQIQYFVVTQDPGCPTSDSILNNTAWITVNGLVSSVDNAQVTLVCNTVSSPTYTPYITPSYTSTFTYTSTQTPTPYYIFTDTPTPSPTNTETQTNLTPYITFTATITITFTQTETSVIILPTHTYTQTPSSKEESQIKTINIYPNPFDPRKHDMRIFLLCNNQYKTAYVKIYTKSGRLIREIIKNNDEIINNTIKIENINFKNLANGIYLIIITIKDETEKIVNSHIQTLIILRSK